MEKVSTVDIGSVIKNMAKRDAILIKYSSYSYPGLIFFSFVKTLREQYDNRIGIVIVDMLDNLSIIRYQAEAFGINLDDFLRDTAVLKVGGSIDAGNVQERLKISTSYLIHREKFRDRLESLIKRFEDREFIVKITFGFDKFLMLLDERERLFQVHDMVRHLTIKSFDVRDVIFINTDLWRNLNPYVTEYLEETVLFIGEIIDPHHVKILKSIVPDFIGKVIRF